MAAIKTEAISAWLSYNRGSFRKRFLLAFGVGTFIFWGMGMLFTILAPVRAQTGPATPPAINLGPGSAYSYGQQGGLTAGTVNLAPPQRTLSAPYASTLKSQMLSEIPKDKPITIMAILGDTESINFANEIYLFLKQNGFTMKDPAGISQGAFMSIPKGLSLNKKPNGELDFVVGTP